jgi:hypothetical protein
MTRTGSPPHLGKPSVCVRGSIKCAEGETLTDVQFLVIWGSTAFQIEMKGIHFEMLASCASPPKSAYRPRF